jgi:pimeloyl-ACP methyl ester carboxylesterase
MSSTTFISLIAISIATHAACSTPDDPLASDGDLLDSGAVAVTTGDCPASRVPLFLIDPRIYPYPARCLTTAAGTVHYVDEGPRGAAETVLFVHGNPTWSYLYRELIDREVAAGRRVVAADYLGYGLSDKPGLAGFTPSTPFDYTPRSQSTVLETLVTALDLRRVTLVVQDWGGPVGLGVATRQPARFARILIMNTWAWSVSTTNPGIDHTIVDWSIDHHVNAADHIQTCNIPRLAAAEIARRRGDTGAAKATTLASYTAPWANPMTQQPRTPTVCTPTVTMAQSIIDRGDFQDEVGAGLGNLRGKPISYVFGGLDSIFGEARCDLDQPSARWCAAYPGTTCTCDPAFAAADGRACTATPPGKPVDEWVCRAPGNARVMPYLTRLRAMIGDQGLVESLVIPGADHFLPETSSPEIGAVLDRLIAVVAR